MSTVINYHIGSTFGNNCCLFQCFAYYLRLSCVDSLCVVLLVLVLFVVLYVRIACRLHVLDVCTRGNKYFVFRISLFSQHHAMAHPVHPIKTGQCGPYDDISSGQNTTNVDIHIPPYGYRMGPYYEFFLMYIYIPRVDIALALCRQLTLLPSFHW